MEIIALVLLDDGDISANEYENILHEIAMCARQQRYQEQEQERETTRTGNPT